MKTHTFEEMLNDIRRFEGILELQIPGTWEGWEFLQLYSEVHTLPLSDDACVDDLKARVHKYINNTCNLLPPNTEVNWDADVNLYEVHFKPDGSLLKFVKLGDFEAYDKSVFAVANSMACTTTDIALLIKEDKSILFKSKMTSHMN